MFESKPNPVAFFDKGKSIYAKTVKNCAKTFNWLISCLSNLETDGDGLIISGLKDGKPKVKLALKAGSNVKLRPAGKGMLEISSTFGSDSFVSGEHSNVVFTPRSDGKIAVDVYYV